ncbi:MAG: hypothetical protein WC310_04950 [Patescibacteria group bacterium]|jgi:membrane protein DedA with SNARE-associated domain
MFAGLVGFLIGYGVGMIISSELRRKTKDYFNLAKQYIPKDEEGKKDGD